MSNYYEGTECQRHGWSSNNAYKECPHCKKEDVEIADLKAKYQKALECIHWYSNWDWSDKYVQAVPKNAQKTLAELGEKE